MLRAIHRAASPALAGRAYAAAANQPKLMKGESEGSIWLATHTMSAQRFTPDAETRRGCSAPAAAASAYGEGPTTLVTADAFEFIVDEPPKLGGRGLGESSSAQPLHGRAACSFGTVAAAVWRARSSSPLRAVATFLLPAALVRPAGPNPLSYFLGSLVGCTGYTAQMVAKEQKVPELRCVLWQASGQYDLRGVRGVDDVEAKCACT